MDDGELVGAEAAQLGAVFVDLDAGHDRRGACGAEPVAQPAFEGERGRVAGRVHADAQVVAAPRAVDVALEEPAVDLAGVLAGADGGQQQREQIVLSSLGAEQLERAPAVQRAGRAGGRRDAPAERIASDRRACPATSSASGSSTTMTTASRRRPSRSTISSSGGQISNTRSWSPRSAAAPGAVRSTGNSSSPSPSCTWRGTSAACRQRRMSAGVRTPGGTRQLAGAITKPSRQRRGMKASSPSGPSGSAQEACWRHRLQPTSRRAIPAGAVRDRSRANDARDDRRRRSRVRAARARRARRDRRPGRARQARVRRRRRRRCLGSSAKAPASDATSSGAPRDRSAPAPARRRHRWRSPAGARAVRRRRARRRPCVASLPSAWPKRPSEAPAGACRPSNQPVPGGWRGRRGTGARNSSALQGRRRAGDVAQRVRERRRRPARLRPARAPRLRDRVEQQGQHRRVGRAADGSSSSPCSSTP